MQNDLRQQARPLKVEQIEELISSLDERWNTDPFLIKRHQQRWALRAPVDLYFTGSDGVEKSVYASCRDINAQGIGLLCREPLEPGTRAELVIDIDGTKYCAALRIVHCTQTVGGYKVGCEFIREQQPSLAAADGPAESQQASDPSEGAG